MCNKINCHYKLSNNNFSYVKNVNNNVGNFYKPFLLLFFILLYESNCIGFEDSTVYLEIA